MHGQAALLGLGCLGVGALAAVGVLASVLAQAADSLVEVVPYLAGGLTVCLAGWIAYLGWRRVVARRHQAFVAAGRALAGKPGPTEEDVRGVVALREKAGQLPREMAAQLAEAYRGAISEVVADGHLTGAERGRVDLVKRGLGLPQDVVARAAIEGFLGGHAVLVGDGRLTAEEDAALTSLRDALAVPEAAVRAQLAQAGELRKARDVATGDLAAVEADIKLRDGEACYYWAPVSERKKRARAYVENGVRHTETAFEDVRSGNLYITNQRLLMVAEGTTTIKPEKVMDCAVDSDERLLVLTVDGRKTPWYFALYEPFVAAAYVDRVVAAA